MQIVHGALIICMFYGFKGFRANDIWREPKSLRGGKTSCPVFLSKNKVIGYILK